MDAGTSGARRLILGPSLKHMRMRDRVFAEYLTPWWGITLDDLYADESVAENEQCGFGYRRYQDEETENHIQQRILSALRLSWSEYSAIFNGLDYDDTAAEETDLIETPGCGTLKQRGLILRLMLDNVTQEISKQSQTQTDEPLIVPTQRSQCPDPLPVATNRMIAEKISALTGRPIQEYRQTDETDEIRTFRGSIPNPQQPN